MAWENAERAGRADFDQAVAVVRRAKSLYLERLEILREIHRENPSDLKEEELRSAEETIHAQVQSAENILFQSRFNVIAHESLANAFYYEGRMEDFQAHYERQGYKVLEADANTGRSPSSHA